MDGLRGLAILLVDPAAGACAAMSGSLIVDGSLPAHLGESAADMLAAHLLAGRREARPR